MSIQAMTWVIDNSKQTGLGFVTLLMIANHANAEGRQSYPSMKTLARECRSSLRSIQRTILKLEKSGELNVDRSGGRVSHSYSLPLMLNVDTESTLPTRQRRHRDHVNTVERGQIVATLQHGHLDTVNVDTTGHNVDIAMSTEPINHKKEKNAHACLLEYHSKRIGKIPDGAAQAGAVKWILENFSPEQAIGCYEFQLSEDWRRGMVSWLTVKGKIGAWVASQPKPMPKIDRAALDAERKKKMGWDKLEQRTP